MKVVIDGIGVVPFGGYAVALEGLLAGWTELPEGDELHLVLKEGVDLDVPPGIKIHRVGVGRPAALRRVVVQSRVLRRICRAVGADALLGILPTTAVTDVGCPKVITVYDMRHELLPDQFTASQRAVRKISYDIGYRQADSIICISDRTRNDLLRSRPWLESKPVVTVLWGADHVDAWPRRTLENGEPPYALAFGHFVNKGVDRVIDAWRILDRRGGARPLVFVGLPRSAREGVVAKIGEAGLGGTITPLPWLDDDEFHARFASAGLIVFPSDFEGFGLPAVEALRLNIPLVISTDEALLEVTGGNAEIVEGTDPEALADAVARAWARSPEAIAQAREHVESFTWKKMAAGTRDVLADAAAAAR